MANLPNVRLESAVRFKVKLTDNGVQLNWSSLSDVAALLYSESQRMVAGVASVAVDAEDSKILIVDYAGHKPQYSGIAKLIVRGKYQGREKTFDAPVINFVDSTAQATGVTVVSDPVVSVTLSVQEVSTSMLDDAIAAAFNNAALAQAATASANTAASSANTAATNATNKANLADQKATLAQEAATAANTAKTGANTAAQLANEKALLAEQKAGVAQASATSADSAAALANEKATLANTKATLADQKAALAQEKATAAQTAANNATTAAQSANSAAQAANTATATIQASLVDYRKAADQDAIDATKASASELAQLSSKMGDLSNLTTTAKTDLVVAINSLKSAFDNLVVIDNVAL